MIKSAPASTNRCLSMRESGTATTVMPAALADCTPNGLSSNARQCSGATPARFAATKKMSGAGLPSLTASSSPVTTVTNLPNMSSCALRLHATALRLLLVATACTSPRAAPSSTIALAPGSALTVANNASRLWCQPSTISCTLSTSSSSSCSSTSVAQSASRKPTILALSCQSTRLSLPAAAITWLIATVDKGSVSSNVPSKS